METENQNFSRRSRSTRRLRHEAKSEVFIREKGSLEDIRVGLGLRPSQICELLKVHPSAWIRWTRSGHVPPHVYQSLEWYLELLRWRGQKHPLPEVQAMKNVNREDPQVYVPAHPLEPSKNPHFWGVFQRHQIWILALSVTFQLLLTGFIVFYVVRFGPGGK